MDWTEFDLSFSMNFLQSIGNIWLPLDTTVIPGFFFSSFFTDGILNPVISSTYFAVELYLATFILSRCLGFSPAFSIFPAWFLPLISMPYFWPTWITPTFNLGPQLSTLASVNAVILCLFMLIGRRGIILSATMALLICLLLIGIIIWVPVLSALLVPSLSILGAFALVGASHKREFLHKAISALLILAVLLSLGTLQFIYGIYSYTSTHYFPDEFFNTSSSWYSTSILFHAKVWGLIGPVLVSLAILGGFLAYRQSVKPLRWLGAGVLCWAFIMLTTGFLSVMVFDSWSAPRMMLFELVLLPVYACFATYAFFTMGRLLITTIGRLPYVPILPAHIQIHMGRFWPAYIFVVTVALTLTNKLAPNTNKWVWPPLETEITALLKNNIGLSPGAVFQGRVANISGGKGNYAPTWFNQSGFDTALRAATGNDHRLVGLWINNIPTLSEHSSFITPTFYLVTKRLLSSESDVPMRSMLTLTKFNRKILEVLGVRYVISDEALGDGAILRVTLDVPKINKVFLYELPSPNLGTYYPTRTIVVSSASEAMRYMSGDSIDFRHDVIADQVLPKDLVPALSNKMEIYPDLIRINARSEGESVIVLPLEYSNCLEYELKSNAEGPYKIFRANLTQVGIIFTQSIEGSIRFRYGLLSNNHCRLDDMEDMKRLNISG